jgi:hypothetical protein
MEIIDKLLIHIYIINICIEKRFVMKKALQRKNYVLDVKTLKKAQQAIGAKTETETIHKALEMATSEVALAEALHKLVHRGKGRVIDAFSSK